MGVHNKCASPTVVSDLPMEFAKCPQCPPTPIGGGKKVVPRSPLFDRKDVVYMHLTSGWKSRAGIVDQVRAPCGRGVHLPHTPRQKLANDPVQRTYTLSVHVLSLVLGYTLRYSAPLLTTVPPERGCRRTPTCSHHDSILLSAAATGREVAYCTRVLTRTA